MADIKILDSAQSSTDQTDTIWGPYWINTATALIITVGTGGSTIFFFRTTDGGATWNSSTLQTFAACLAMSVWFDQETPGDEGTLVHVAWASTTDVDFIYYKTVDVSDGSLGTLREVDATVTVDSSPGDNRICITKTKSGNLIVAFTTQLDLECYRSDDAGVTWTDRADVYETAIQEDYCLLFPANTADDDDACGLFWDRSSNTISVKMYDESANTWTETSILTSMVDDSFHANMDGAVRHSDGFILGAAHSNDDFSTDDLLTFTINPDSIASPTIDTTTANVFTDQGESAQCCVFINQQNDDVYIAYLKGGTWSSTVDVVFHKSTDDMSSWGSEQAYSEGAASDFRLIKAGRTVGAFGGSFQPVFYNDNTTDDWVNFVNAVAFPNSIAELSGRTEAEKGTGSIQDLAARTEAEKSASPSTPVVVTKFISADFLSLTSILPKIPVENQGFTAISSLRSLPVGYRQPLVLLRKIPLDSVLSYTNDYLGPIDYMVSLTNSYKLSAEFRNLFDSLRKISINFNDIISNQYISPIDYLLSNSNVNKNSVEFLSDISVNPKIPVGFAQSLTSLLKTPIEVLLIISPINKFVIEFGGAELITIRHSIQVEFRGIISESQNLLIENIIPFISLKTSPIDYVRDISQLNSIPTSYSSSLTFSNKLPIDYISSPNINYLSPIDYVSSFATNNKLSMGFVQSIVDLQKISINFDNLLTTQNILPAGYLLSTTSFNQNPVEFLAGFNFNVDIPVDYSGISPLTSITANRFFPVEYLFSNEIINKIPIELQLTPIQAQEVWILSERKPTSLFEIESSGNTLAGSWILLERD